ncbi:hypothetical protein M426DRAFT_315968 [Hypoxylon sp. CI-4A]|nr:hypothetical protein M426DRAFT_315968 [Hypoxylon sp. CI-4A]
MYSMPRTRQDIKHERATSPIASVMPGTMEPPPPVAPSKRRRLDTQSTTQSITQSVAPSFVRSLAPSAESRPHKDDDGEPIFMEMKRGPDSFRSGRQGTPGSQTADTSFGQLQQSFAHPTFAGIGQKQKACNDTLGDLQTLGVSHVAALPELVLVGDQSSGKSSLMSGLARVNLPRSAGVCTRCPLHIRLISSKSDNWSCTVSLQRDYDFQPQPNRKPRTSDVTAANPFPPWVKMSHRNIETFKTIFDPSEIEGVLRWAQIAILNHTKNFELFIPDEGFIAKNNSLDVAASETEAQFSPNIVALEMKGPGLPDLSFYDLPGVFQSPEKEEDEYIVKVVKNLTREYIKRKKAIIMWALPMNVDLENSITLPIIREAKAADRTIGVMTKADQLPPQNIPNWLTKFRDEKKLIGHGFFATSRPPDQLLEDVAKWEELFFTHRADGSSPWPTEFDDFLDRCGVEVLLKYLSSKLGEAFAESLPSIKETVYRRLTVVQSELAALPELPVNVEHEVKRSLVQFLSQVKISMKDTRFSSEWNTLNSQFQACIFKIKPTCKVKDSELQTIDLSGGDSEATPTPSRRPRPSDSTMRNVATPSRRQRQDDPVTPTPTPIKREDFPPSSVSRASSIVSATESHSLGPFSRYASLGRLAMDIRDIRSRILRNKRPGMPRDLVPDEVRETLCLDAVKKWEEPLRTYVDKTEELLKRTINDALQESLGTLRRRLIFNECQEYLEEFIQSTVVDQTARLTDMFNNETYQLYMMNDDVFHRYKAEEMEQLKRVRGIIRLKALTLLDWGYTANRRLEDMSEEEKTKERKMLETQLPKIGKDPFDTEIEVAGFVRGYYMMAAARFVEGVTLNVNASLLRAFREEQLDMRFDEVFNIYSHSDPRQYARLMEEDEETAKKREQFKGETEKLERAMHSIIELEKVSGGTSFGYPNVTIVNSDSELEESLFV